MPLDGRPSANSSASRTVEVQLDVGIRRGGLRVFTQHAAQALGKRRILYLHRRIISLNLLLRSPCGPRRLSL